MRTTNEVRRKTYGYRIGTIETLLKTAVDHKLRVQSDIDEKYEDLYKEIMINDKAIEILFKFINPTAPHRYGINPYAIKDNQRCCGENGYDIMVNIADFEEDATIVYNKITKSIDSVRDLCDTNPSDANISSRIDNIIIDICYRISEYQSLVFNHLFEVTSELNRARDLTRKINSDLKDAEKLAGYTLFVD